MCVEVNERLISSRFPAYLHSDFSMYFNLSQRFLSGFLATLKLDDRSGSSALSVILALALVLGTWRVWKFSTLYSPRHASFGAKGTTMLDSL